MTFSGISVSAGDPARVRAAIGNAAQQTGVDFGYLLAQAKSESGLNPSAHARASSAGGLYQFLDSSWLAVVKRHGAAHGLGWAAEAIEAKPGGGFTVADPSLRRAVMALREQPEPSALMAAAYASDNAAALTSALGRTPTGTDLYMAHFLGLGGATHFLKAAAADPGASAVALFPREAAANRSIFYDGDGNPRSLAGVQGIMARKLGTGGAAAEAAVAGPDASDGTADAFARAAGQFDAIAQAGGQGAGGAGSPDTGTALAAASPATLLRPNPANARLAYLLLTSMGAGSPA